MAVCVRLWDVVCQWPLTGLNARCINKVWHIFPVLHGIAGQVKRETFENEWWCMKLKIGYYSKLIMAYKEVNNVSKVLLLVHILVCTRCVLLGSHTFVVIFRVLSRFWKNTSFACKGPEISSHWSYANYFQKTRIVAMSCNAMQWWIMFWHEWLLDVPQLRPARFMYICTHGGRAQTRDVCKYWDICK